MRPEQATPADSKAMILLVDDDPEALEELEEILELEDMPALKATCIDEAYACLSSRPEITTVVTDVHLTAPSGAKANGLDFVSLAARRFPERDLSFVVLSGDANAVCRSFDTGAVDFLTKPLMPDALIAAIRRAEDAPGQKKSDVASALRRKVKEATKSLQQANADLAERELELSESREAYERHRLLGSKLKRAIAEGEVVPWFQPQVCIRTGEVVGFEALARWDDPTHGIRGPGAFLPAAEAVGLMQDLTATILHQTLSAMTEFHRRGFDRCRMSINVDGGVLSDPEFADKLTLAVDGAGLPSQTLAIEVLESVMLSDACDDPVRSGINRLNRIGFGIELDDFGTGRAALSSLRDLDVQRVKIDRSFIVNVDTDRKLQKFTRALISLSEALEIEVLAEGVETEAELSWLMAEGCDAVQGYLIAKPMPLSKALEWAGDWKPRRHGLLSSDAA